MPKFRPNTVIQDVQGKPILIKNFLATGGQAHIYEVVYQGKLMVLKWYKEGKINHPDAFHKNLENNITKGSPDHSFVWAKALTKKMYGSFGYIMEKIPQGYYEMAEFNTGYRKFDSYKTLVRAARNLVIAFKLLHERGYSYQDISSKNILINPHTGEVKICDCDNIAENGKNFGIYGTGRFMAPELIYPGKLKVNQNSDGSVKPEWVVVNGVKKFNWKLGTPNIHTDEFSLAVCLLLLLCHDFPFDGQNTIKNHAQTQAERRELYGENPVFVCDPTNDINRPKQNVQRGILKYWNLLPQYLQKTFVEAFSKKAIDNPVCRVSVDTWIDVILRFEADIVRCTRCGNEMILKSGNRVQCRNRKCSAENEIHHFLVLPNYRIPLQRGATVYRRQVDCLCKGAEALDEIVAIGVKKGTKQPVIVNRSKTPLLLSVAGREKTIQPNCAELLCSGLSIKFNNKNIYIQ